MSPAKTPLPDLPKGHTFAPTTFSLSRDEIARYLAATGDEGDAYERSGLAPPLAVAAKALGTLLDVLELPGGTLHTGQEIDMRGGVRSGATLTLSGRVAQRSERGGAVISVIEFDVTVEGADSPALTGRTTVAVAGG